MTDRMTSNHKNSGAAQPAGGGRRADRDGALLLYTHSGSGNHGCEAIARTLSAQLLGAQRPLVLISNDLGEEERYGITKIPGLTVLEERHIDRHFFAHVAYYGYRKLTGDKESFLRYRFGPAIKPKAPALALSIGGDNYCYANMLSDMILAHSMFRHQGSRTALLGCSVEPELVENSAVAADMRAYGRITARESISYEALRKLGMDDAQLRLLPDPAFTLPADMEGAKAILPPGFAPGQTIGINLSPLVDDYGEAGLAYESVKALIAHILEEKDASVLLIAHVVWARSSDPSVLAKLMTEFPKEVAEGRLMELLDAPAPVLKGAIARCRAFIGARTHATIAAYSTEVPTLVLGYSVKARGIARDLFGSEDNAVLPVQELTDPAQLIRSYEWLRTNEEDMRTQLHRVMPGVISKALRHGEAALELL